MGRSSCFAHLAVTEQHYHSVEVVFLGNVMGNIHTLFLYNTKLTFWVYVILELPCADWTVALTVLNIAKSLLVTTTNNTQTNFSAINLYVHLSRLPDQRSEKNINYTLINHNLIIDSNNPGCLEKVDNQYINLKNLIHPLVNLNSKPP